MNEYPAGRELDAMIAEKVMGYKLLWAHKVWSVEDWLTTGYPTEQNTMAIVTEGSTLSQPRYLVIPHYSTDIAAAWQIVDWVKTTGNITIQVLPYATWVELHVIVGGAFRRAVVSAATTPLAICLAALDALSS